MAESIDKPLFVRRNRHYYNNEDDKQNAIKQMKREWYQRNKERQQVVSLIYYYEKLLKQKPDNEMFNDKLEKLRERLKELPTVRVVSRPKPGQTITLSMEKVMRTAPDA